MLCAAGAATAQPGPRPSPAPSDPPIMYWEAYEPVSTLQVPSHPVSSALYPFVDVHAHQFGAPGMSESVLDSLLREMEGLNMAVMVNLSGRSGEALQASIRNMDDRRPGRFVQFANISFTGIDDPNWGAQTADQLEADVRAGARGLKIYKNLGMTAMDGAGRRIPVDDPRIEPVWERAGTLGIPVLIHSADPAPFWDPHDAANERWYELKERPGRVRPPGQFPPWEQIIAEQHNLFRKHPNTNFIAAHLGWLGNDLDRLGALLEELPNVYTEVGAVLAELGRQPRHARDFLIRHRDRVLFGKDAWAPDEYRVYFRAFETADEYFDYYRKRHAHWKIYGMDLPDDVLRHVYYKNALRIIPGLDRTLFPPD